MVYIQLNQNILSSLPPNKLKNYQILNIQKNQYIKYENFKILCKTNNTQLYKYVKINQIISQIDIDRLIQLSKRTPEEKRFIQDLKNKHQMRLMNSFDVNDNMNRKNKQINSQLYYYGKSITSNDGNNVKQLTDSVSFGITFIFSFFMAGLTGYYFAQYFFHFQLTGSLIVSIIFIFTTLFIQTWLYMIKQTKANRQLKQDRKKRQNFTYLNQQKKKFENINQTINKKGKLKKD